jgi:hypothetical protein
MKKVITKLIIVLLCLLSFACKKNDRATEPQGTNELLKTKISNSIKSNTNSENELSLKNLLSNLKWDDLVFQKEANGDIAIIPIDNKFKTDNNANNPVSNFLVFNEDSKTGKTSLGITQYEGGNDISATAKSLAALYNNINNNITGKLTFITLDDVFLAECYYTNGEKIKSKTIQENKTSSTTTNSSSSNCTTYYLLTTITIDGVVVNQELEYLYTICNSCDGGVQRLANPYTGRVACGNGGGGGGGDNGSAAQEEHNNAANANYEHVTNHTFYASSNLYNMPNYEFFCAKHNWGWWNVTANAQWTTIKNGNNVSVSNLICSGSSLNVGVTLLLNSMTFSSDASPTPVINNNNTTNPKGTIISKGNLRIKSNVPIFGLFLDQTFTTKGTLNISFL